MELHELTVTLATLDDGAVAINSALENPVDLFEVHRDVGGFTSLSSLLAPPYVTMRQFESYKVSNPELPGMTFDVEWWIHSLPASGPRTWMQRVRDGFESPSVSDRADLALRVEVGYEAFLRFIVLGIPLRQMPGEARVEGSLAALSSLHWMVEQPTWLRGPIIASPGHEAALAFVGPV